MYCVLCTTNAVRKTFRVLFYVFIDVFIQRTCTYWKGFYGKLAIQTYTRGVCNYTCIKRITQDTIRLRWYNIAYVVCVIV